MSGSEGFTPSETLTNETLTNEAQNKTHAIQPNRSFNDSIGLMLRSYTRAVNLQEKRTGSLFRKETKAECITKIDEGITASYFNEAYGTSLNIRDVAKSYPKVCFDYIHHNPVVAGLCTKPEDWEFSSFVDYSGLRDGKLIARERANEFGLIV